MRRVMAMSLALMLAMPAVAQDQIGGGETEIGNGTASYYGRELAGNRTASGERFDPDQMTAAHPTLAFGSKVLVLGIDRIGRGERGDGHFARGERGNQRQAHLAVEANRFENRMQRIRDSPCIARIELAFARFGPREAQQHP